MFMYIILLAFFYMVSDSLLQKQDTMLLTSNSQNCESVKVGRSNIYIIIEQLSNMGSVEVMKM